LAFGIALAVFAAVGTLIAQTGITGGSAGTPATAITASSSGIIAISGSDKPRKVLHVQPVAGGGHESTSAARAAYRFPADGSLVSAARMWSSAEAHASSNASRGTSEIGDLSLFRGRIQLTDATLRADTSVKQGTAGGSFQLSESARLVVDGHTLPLTPNKIIAVRGVGTVTVNEQAVVAASPRGDKQTGPRYKIVGAVAHVRLAAPYGGFPAGSQLIIGRVEAGVRTGSVDSIGHPSAADALSRPTTPTGITLQPGTPAPGELSLPRRSTSVHGTAPAQGYLFPVLGESNYTDTWGAARASTGIPHQGTDIFAVEGTPIVAIADGVLDRVGWNTIGGYRFWLFDDSGNAFYQAHLSAFSPLAVDGARVKAGDVIGFVGHTGDAQGTPSHLHFEVHPGNGDATNPFPILNDWSKGIATAIGNVLNPNATSFSPFTLLSAADIAPNSGLEDSVLDRVIPGTRPVAEETKPKPTDETLGAAINGDGISGN
jgi:murein DD-endopeptidase MepM/ murein hydrolase activator NlpD